MKTWQWLVPFFIFFTQALMSQPMGSNTNKLEWQGEWIITKLMVNRKLIDVKDQAFSFILSDSSFRAKICNSFSGSMHFLPNAVLHMGPAISTRMICADMQWEHAFEQGIRRVNAYMVKNGQLQLLEKGKVVMVLQRPAVVVVESPADTAQIDYAAMVQQARYKVISISDEKGTASYMGTAANLQFNVIEKRISGKGICNVFFGSAILQFTSYHAGTVAIGNMGTTLMACSEDLELEQRLLALLEQVDHFEMKGGTMFLKIGSKVVIELAT